MLERDLEELEEYDARLLDESPLAQQMLTAERQPWRPSGPASRRPIAPPDDSDSPFLFGNDGGGDSESAPASPSGSVSVDAPPNMRPAAWRYLLQFTKNHEGYIPHMYNNRTANSTLQDVTCGIGFLLSPREVVTRDWVKDMFYDPSTGQTPSNDRMLADWDAAANLARTASNLAQYGVVCKLRMHADQVYKHMALILRDQKLPALLKTWPDIFGNFSGFPAAAQVFSVSFAYGIIPSHDPKSPYYFPRLLAAIGDGRWADASNECRMRGASQLKNEAHRQLLLMAQEVVDRNLDPDTLPPLPGYQAQQEFETEATEMVTPGTEISEATETFGEMESYFAMDETPVAGASEANEIDPFLAIRPSLSSEHENLSADSITMIFGRTPALVALHGMLSSPDLQHATLAALLGKAGRRSVRIHHSNVPIPAYFRMLSRLCREAAEQSEAQESAPAAAFESESPEDAAERSADLIIGGYSEYSAQIGADKKALVTRAAQRIVDSFATDEPIGTVRVIGHADVAQKKPPSERPKVEMDVSIRRAQAAAQDLRAEVERLGRGKNPEPAKFVKFETAGMGATMNMILHPRNQSQMGINRRVEIFFTKGPLQISWTWLDAARRGLVLVPPDTDSHKRIRCVLNLILKLRRGADDGYLDYRTWKDLVIPAGSTEAQREDILRKAIIHLEKQLGLRGDFGPANEIPDNLFVSSLESIDEVITRSMRDFRKNAEVGGAAASVLIVRGWKLIQLNRINPNSIYSCYASFRW